jgi:hypothetical protein
MCFCCLTAFFYFIKKDEWKSQKICHKKMWRKKTYIDQEIWQKPKEHRPCGLWLYQTNEWLAFQGLNQSQAQLHSKTKNPIALFVKFKTYSFIVLPYAWCCTSSVTRFVHPLLISSQSALKWLQTCFLVSPCFEPSNQKCFWQSPACSSHAPKICQNKSKSPSLSYPWLNHLCHLLQMSLLSSFQFVPPTPCWLPSSTRNIYYLIQVSQLKHFCWVFLQIK